MKVIRQLCIKSYEVEDVEGTRWKAQQGKDYLTSLPEQAVKAHGPKPEKGKVIVFSNYWVSVPADHFVLLEGA